MDGQASHHSTSLWLVLSDFACILKIIHTIKLIGQLQNNRFLVWVQSWRKQGITNTNKLLELQKYRKIINTKITDSIILTYNGFSTGGMCDSSEDGNIAVLKVSAKQCDLCWCQLYPFIGYRSVKLSLRCILRYSAVETDHNKIMRLALLDFSLKLLSKETKKTTVIPSL